MFDAVYTGYLGSESQIDMVLDIVSKCAKPGAKFICDPAFADNGKLYPAFDEAYVRAMNRLVQSCDIVVPNISEAAFLVGYEYKESYSEEYVRALMNALCKIGAKSVVLTGVGYDAQSTGVAVYENGQYSYYKHKKCERGCHGTGDVYASAFTGAYMRGHSLFDSARIAADYTLRCIEYSQGDESHTYGPKFEPVLSDLIKAL